MHNITRGVLAGVLAGPLLLGSAGVAAADGGAHASYTSNAVAAGPHGASTHFVHSHAASDHKGGGGHGSHAFYHEHGTYAGPDGAGTWSLTAHAESDHGYSCDEECSDGGSSSYYHEVETSADCDGAHTSETEAYAETSH